LDLKKTITQTGGMIKKIPYINLEDGAEKRDGLRIIQNVSKSYRISQNTK